MPETPDVLPHQIDHIIAKQNGGASTFHNLALSCVYCNTHKGPNIASIDPQSGRIVPLFHPQADRWEEHFQWVGPRLIGLTERGRATIFLFGINDAVNIRAREALIVEGSF